MTEKKPEAEEAKVEKSTFVVNPVILNKWEKDFNIEFVPKELKDYINKFLLESKNWD